MKNDKTNLNMFLWGLKHIADNHGFKVDIDDYMETGNVCIYGGCNVPTLADVQMLCEDCEIEQDCIESSDFGIDIFFTKEWWCTKANRLYSKPLYEFWKRANA